MCDVLTKSPVVEQCRRRVAADLVQSRRDLAPLETGQLQIGERITGGQWVDVTKGTIASHRQMIKTLEAVLTALG